MSDRASSEAQMRPLRRPALAVLGGCLLLAVLYLGWRASGLDSDQGAEGMPAPESEVASPTAEPTSTTLEPLRGPTLLANAGERGDSRDPTLGQPIATQPHLRVRVVAADKPVEGVSIGVWSTVEEVAEPTPAQLALAWLLHQDGVTTVIIGAKKMEQLEDNLKAIDVTFTAAELQQLDAVSQLPPEYPGWMYQMQGRDRKAQMEKWGVK